MLQNDSRQPPKGSHELKIDLAEMLKGGAIIEVSNPEQARIAEDAGAVAVVVVEKLSGDFHNHTPIPRMTHPENIQAIQEAVSIPIMAKCRVGHLVEAQILESLFVDYIDESETLAVVDEQFPIDKHALRCPFICGYSNLEEALSRIVEGAAMVRTNGNGTTGNIVETVRALRTISLEIRKLTVMSMTELYQEARRLRAPVDLVEKIARAGTLPVPNFAAGGIIYPADAALMIHLGAQSVFVSADLFKLKDPLQQAKAVVGALSFHDDPEMLANISKGVLGSTKGLEMSDMNQEAMLAQRGW